jgi:hypothetical protein
MLTFNEEKHEYQLNGVVIPSVTQIINSVLRPFEKINPAVLERAAWRGTCIHKMIELFELGTLDMSTVDHQFVPYLEAWKKFKAESGFEVEQSLIERPMVHSVFRYGLKPDLVGMLGRNFVVLDIKSGDIQIATALQTAAYQEGINNGLFQGIDNTVPCDLRIRQRIALQLKDNGKYKMIKYTDRQDWNLFLSALSIYNWKGNHNVK